MSALYKSYLYPTKGRHALELNRLNFKKKIHYLTWCWNTNSAWPVVVQVSHFVGESLHVTWFQIQTILNNNVMSWTHCALPYMLGHNEVVVPANTQK